MEQLFPLSRSMDPADIYRDVSFPMSAEDRPYTAINMVTTVDGKATLEGKAFSLGTAVDRLAMRRLRSAADAVLNGAETLRREKVVPGVFPDMEDERTTRGMSRQPMGIVVTSTGDLPLERSYFQKKQVPVVVITTERAPREKLLAAEAYARVLRIGEEVVDIPRMMRELVSQLGVRRLVVEGGPRLNGALFTAGMVDELFWTVAPKVLGGTALKTMVEGMPLPIDRIARLELVSVHLHESELFIRYRILH